MPDLDRVGLDFIQTAPVLIHVTVDLLSTPAQVWEVLNATEQWPQWFEGMSEARVTSAAWEGVGSTRFVKIGPLAVDEEMVVWEPEQHWGFCATQLSWSGYIAKKLLETVRIRPEGTGSQLRYTGALEPVPWLKPVTGLIKKQMRGSWQAALAAIDQQVAPATS